MKKMVIKPEEELERIINNIKDYFIKNGTEKTKAVIGISGGKDSTIAAALLVRALGPKRVIGVVMPNGEQSDINDAYEVCNCLGIYPYEVNIGAIASALYRALDDSDFCNMPHKDPDYSCAHNPTISTNSPARLRMTVLYAVAALVGGRVINTGNASELYIGYTTKYGDLAGDYALFNAYYVREVYQIGQLLTELPAHLVTKTPSDGMCGKSDEDNLGFTYETLDAYLLDNVVPDYDTLRNITERYARNLHKNVIKIPHPRPIRFHVEKGEEITDSTQWSF